MRIALLAGHVGSSGLTPPGDHGGGEAATFGILRQLMDYYDVTLVVGNGIHPALHTAKDYGYDVENAHWCNYGPSLDWLSSYDAMIAINHHRLYPPMTRLNILYSFFPQHKNWNVKGYQYVLADSHYAAKWIKGYWGTEAEVVYPPINLVGLNTQIFSVSEAEPGLGNIYQKEKKIVSVGRFFAVPGGNNKRHDILIQAFKSMFLEDWKLVLCGAVLDQAYYSRIRELAGDDDRIEFVHDLGRQDYIQMMREASFVWSATGYEATEASSVEHFGIFTLEGQAVGAPVLAHNSGGPKEMGALTWDSPKDLIDQTVDLINRPARYKKEQEAGLIRARNYVRDTGVGSTIVDFLEKPDLLPPAKNRRKIFVQDVRPENIKIGMISDSPSRTYGFSVPAKMIAKGLKRLGYGVSVMGLQDPWRGQPDVPDYGVIRDHLVEDVYTVGLKELEDAIDAANAAHIPVWRGWEGDLNGYSNLGRWIKEEKPDVLYVGYDLGNVRVWLDLIRQQGINLPIVAHVPVEGAPVIDSFIETLRLIKVMNGTPLLYTEWASQEVIKAGGPACPWVWLGGDHADFKPLRQEQRAELRKAIGWEDRTVLFAGGRNKRTKGAPAVFRTMQLLVEQYPDILLYWHTNVADHVPNSSYPLDEIRSVLGLKDHIVFAPDLGDQGEGVGYENAPGIEVPDTDDINEVYRENLKGMTLIERIGCADIFFNLSEIEGFNLWLVEAMGMGLPIVSVDDEGVQREVLGKAAQFVNVEHWDMWHTGVILAQADPVDAAQAVAEVIEDNELRSALVQKSLERYRCFTWQNVVSEIDGIIKERLGV